MAKKRIVVDTNVLISGFIFPGSAISELLERILSGEFDLGMSDEILNEFKKVLRNKFGLSSEIAGEYAEIMSVNAVAVKPKEKITALKDKEDNRVLECGVEFGARYIITGDKQFLNHKKYKNIKIISPADFIRRNL